jgi:aminoglycoside/choline kinase family phosphotransferase
VPSLIEQKILACRPDVKSIQPLRQEVSSRRYYRLQLADGSTCVAVDYSALPQSGIDFFAVQQECKKAGISVPEIYHNDHAEMLLLQQDLGDTDLCHALTHAPESARIELLKEAIDHILLFLRMKKSSPIAERFFDYEKLWQEMEHTFAGIALAGLPEFTASIQYSSKVVLEDICKKLADKAHYAAHRDYHSRNIMLCNGKQVVIDFQDARMGSCYYDLTSLLYDPYLHITRQERDECLDYFISHFFKESNDTFSKDLFYSQAIQRLFKALGTYFHQVFGRGDVSFKKSLAAALVQLDEIILRRCYPDSLYLYIQHLSKHSG